MLFQKRKLAAQRKLCDKELARTSYYMESDPLLFTAAQRAEIGAAASRLEVASRTEENPDILADELKFFKKAVDKFLPPWRKSIVREYAEAIIIALILALFIRAFIVQAFKIPSGSMIPTLLIGDHLVVNKFIYGFEVPFKLKKVLPIRKPERGEIIVFRFPSDVTKDFIKRVVGAPGDRIRMENKRLYINDKEVPMELIGPYTYADQTDIPQKGLLYEENLNGHKHKVLFSDTVPSMMDNFTVVVPQGKYFCMGDNRDRSNDSRFWGFVDFNLIRGKAMIIYFSWPPRQWTRILSLTK
jgi:signal peptidase I